MAFSRLNMTYHDYNEEKSQVGFRGTKLTAENFAVQDGLMDDLEDAVEDVTIGLLVKEMRIASESKPAAGAAASTSAQRELKWLVRAYDTTTGDAVSVQIPCADVTLLLPNSDKMDPENAAYTAFVSAFEAFHLSNGGNAVEVIEIILVGRNL